MALSLSTYYNLETRTSASFLTFIALFGEFCNISKFLTRIFIFALNKADKHISKIDGNIKQFKSLDKKTIEFHYLNFSKISSKFDKLHGKLHTVDYLGNEKIKLSMKTICRKLHKIENVLRIYSFDKSIKSEETPSYIKDGLSKFSQESFLSLQP